MYTCISACCFSNTFKGLVYFLKQDSNTVLSFISFLFLKDSFYAQLHRCTLYRLYTDHTLYRLYTADHTLYMLHTADHTLYRLCTSDHVLGTSEWFAVCIIYKWVTNTNTPFSEDDPYLELLSLSRCGKEHLPNHKQLFQCMFVHTCMCVCVCVSTKDKSKLI